MNFCSDNVAGVAPEILEALAAANGAPASMPYGNDPWTDRVAERVADVFEREVAVYPVATGTAANAVGLATVTPSYGAIYCHELAHIHVDECGAPELFSGGAKLVDLPGDDGKLDAARVREAIAASGIGDVHHVQAAAVSIAQATETGTIYRLEEIAAIAEVAREYRLPLHMDGARFANALAAVECTPAEMTWKAGVDILAFGATKNGAMAAEAVVFFDPEQAATFELRRKRGGHLFSKMRFLSAQLDAYLADELWLRNARHANAMAARLAGGLAALEGVQFVYPAAANMLFLEVPKAMADGLESDGFAFYRLTEGATPLLRLVAAFSTRVEDVDGFVASAACHAAVTKSA